MKTILGMLVMLFWAAGGFAADEAKGRLVIHNPSPTVREDGIMFRNLRQIHNIPADFGGDVFFAQPTDIAVSGDGTFYVMDTLLDGALSFSPDFRFIARIGKNHGRGPGDLGDSMFKRMCLVCNDDKTISICDAVNNKVIDFDKTGKVVAEQYFRQLKIHLSRPLRDRAGNYYVLAGTDTVCLYKIAPDGKAQVLLTEEVNRELLHHEAKLRIPEAPGECSLDGDSLRCMLWGDDTLGVFVANSAKLVVLRGGKKILEKKLWPERALRDFQRMGERLRKKMHDNKKTGDFFILMFDCCFVDEDNPKTFFVGPVAEDTSNKNYLYYKFDSRGNPLPGVRLPKKTFLRAKRNGRFYAIDGFESVSIWQEERQ